MWFGGVRCRRVGQNFATRTENEGVVFRDEGRWRVGLFGKLKEGLHFERDNMGNISA